MCSNEVLNLTFFDFVSMKVSVYAPVLSIAIKKTDKNSFLDLFNSNFDRARGMFRPCSRYGSTVLELCFDPARGMFRPCLRYVSAVLEVCMFRRC